MRLYAIPDRTTKRTIITSQNSNNLSVMHAAQLLDLFHEVVGKLCQAQSQEEILAHRAELSDQLASVGQAIEVLKDVSVKHSRVTAPEEPTPTGTSAIAALLDMTSFDRFEDIIFKVTKQAEAQGQCPITVALYRSFYPREVLPAVTPALDSEACRARLLRLAQHMVHEFAPAYLTSCGYPAQVEALKKVPNLTQRDDLPVALATLSELRKNISQQYNVGYHCSRSETALAVINGVYRWMSITLTELDAFLPNSGVVMARMLWVFRLGGEQRDKAALDRALLGT